MQNQLEYLQKSTKEFTDTAASHGAALSWTKSNLNKLEQLIEDFNFNYTLPFEDDCQFFEEQLHYRKLLYTTQLINHYFFVYRR